MYSNVAFGNTHKCIKYKYGVFQKKLGMNDTQKKIFVQKSSILNLIIARIF